MKNIHIIPTPKPSRLWFYKQTDILLTGLTVEKSKDIDTQNIYITNSEEIKVGDWFLKQGKPIIKSGHIKHYAISEPKIILTTDQDLINDGVQAIDDEFLEWFVKNPSCEKVKIESWERKDKWELDYKIIIPKVEQKELRKKLFTLIKSLEQEEPKQETLEEYIFKIPFDYNIKPKEVIDMCMKEQENIILTWRLGHFIDMIDSLPDDTEKNRILKSVFDNRDGELLLESYKSMKKHYEK